MWSMRCLPLPSWALEASFFSPTSYVILIPVLAGTGDGSGEDSDEGERHGKEDDEDEDEEDAGTVDSPVGFRHLRCHLPLMFVDRSMSVVRLQNQNSL